MIFEAMVKGRRTAAGWGLSLLLMAACGGHRAPERAMGSALWVVSDSRTLSTSDLRTLARGGVAELFVEVAELGWESGRPTLRTLPWYEPPERTPATLVIRGSWPPGSVDADDAAKSLAPTVRGLLDQASAHRLEASGIHLDLAVPGDEDSLESLADLIDGLRGEAGAGYSWSTTVDVDAPGAQALAEATDFFVVFLYGGPPGETDDPDSWRFQTAEGRARAASALGRPFLAGVETLGWARLEDGTVVTRTDLTQLAWDRSLETAHGFTLEGADRLTYRFVTKAPTFLGGRELAPGRTIEVQATSSAHVAALLEAIRNDLGPEYRGILFHRLGGLGEGLSLGPEALVNALSGTESAPELEIQVVGGKKSASRWEVELLLRETAGEATDLGFVDANWVEIKAPSNAYFGDVEPGNFYRYELFRRSRSGGLERTLRRPDVIRFYAPFLPPDGELRTGPIRVVHRGDALPLSLSAHFLAPFGREVGVGPLVTQPVPRIEPPAEEPSEGGRVEEEAGETGG